jgi:polyisoprenyl-phosphate glycosyltransferase
MNFRLMREQLRFFGGLINWMGYPAATIDVEHGTRYEGQSTYTYRKLWKLAADTIVAYSDKPLRLAVRFGFVMSVLAFSYGMYIVVLKLAYGSAVMGWPSLIVSIYFIGGIIISLLGIIGIYLGKTLDEARKRPLYVIRNTTNV